MKVTLPHDLPLRSAVEYFAIGAEGMGFDSWADPIGRTVAKGLPPLRRFFGFMLQQRKAAGMGRVTRYAL